MTVKDVLQTVNLSFQHGLAQEGPIRVLIPVFLNTEMVLFLKESNAMTETALIPMVVQTLGSSMTGSLVLELLLFVFNTVETDCFMH